MHLVSRSDTVPSHETEGSAPFPVPFTHPQHQQWKMKWQLFFSFLYFTRDYSTYTSPPPSPSSLFSHTCMPLFLPFTHLPLPPTHHTSPSLTCITHLPIPHTHHTSSLTHTSHLPIPHTHHTSSLTLTHLPQAQ